MEEALPDLSMLLQVNSPGGWNFRAAHF